MGIGPINAARKLCAATNIELGDYDIFEINEAFASQSLATIQELELDQDKVNIYGGALSIGHPLGASGARIIGQTSHILRNEKESRNGLDVHRRGMGIGVAIVNSG